MVVTVIIVTSFINSSSVVLAFPGHRESSSAEDKGTEAASEAK